MQTRDYRQLNETLYTEKLDNGLEVVLLPKPSFNKTYAIFATDFGSIDQHFVPIEKSNPVKVPDGIAHFLEHKLFDKEHGDVFHDFSKNGASANAFTSFTKTAYLFSTVSYVKENLKTLLDFVQTPYFTEKTVEKEKGIIGQEIQMYDDAPDWRLMFGLLQNLYPDHPVHIDIAGTIESINDITAEMLYENYYTFYQPSNMKLFIVGQFDVQELMEFIRTNQAEKEFKTPEVLQRFLPEEQLDQMIQKAEIQMDVSHPKLAIGIRGRETTLKNVEALRYSLTMQMALKLLLGPTSSNYLSLYDEGLIDDSFSIDYTYDRSFNFLSVSGDSDQVGRLAKEIKRIFKEASRNQDVNERHFQMVKKRSIGQALQTLNSLESIAHSFINNEFGQATIFDVVPTLEGITFQDVQNIMDDFLDLNYLSEFRVVPDKKI